jgi:hypothetical protein
MAIGSILFPRFLMGANLPWVHYGIDFGANGWCPEGGVAHDQTELDAAFDKLAAAGIQVVRWFLFCDGRAGIHFSDSGMPSGVDDFVFRDIDAALAAANRHGMRIIFVLIDFHWCKPARIVKGVQLGGRSHVLQDHGGRQALLETVLRPTLERYGIDPSIFAWDIINEPEWIDTVTVEGVREFLNETIAVVRSCTNQPVTVGSAGVRWRDFYRSLDIDFYQVHWYDSLRHQPSLDTPVVQLGFDKPVLLGEFPTRGSKRPVSAIVETARAAGYAGAFFWSLLADDSCSDSSAVPNHDQHRVTEITET